MQKFLIRNSDSMQLCLTSKSKDLLKRKNLYCCGKRKTESSNTPKQRFYSILKQARNCKSSYINYNHCMKDKVHSIVEAKYQLFLVLK